MTKPTGKTDAIAMQHDLDYSMCKHNKNCKNEPIVKWLKLLMVYPIMKDNGDSFWPVT